MRRLISITGLPTDRYNWELFFHIPLLIATRLMQNQRYDRMPRRWFHYIFDPTCTDGEGSERFWKIKPFHQEQLGGATQTLQELLQQGNPDLEQQVQEWELDPFQPYVVARLAHHCFHAGHGHALPGLPDR